MNQWFDKTYYSESDISKHIKILTEKSDNKIFIALNEEGKAVGYTFTGVCYYLGSDPFVEVIQLLVDKDNRGQGIGKKLIEYVSEYYKNQGINVMKLHSRIERERAHSFYKNLGFKEFKQSKFFEKQL
jgi:GNAT superfamily N-acetyltransferase